MEILEIRDLHKRFGSHEVLSGLNMVIPEHTIFGFVGQNGAGKTTTMKIVLGLLRPDGGEVAVCGQRVSYGGTRSNRCVGYLPDVPEFYGYMTPVEYLKLCGEITGLESGRIRARGRELLDLVGLAGDKKRIGGFSRGMKQRLGIAQALLNEPRLLICDEPTSALDPIGRKEILDILSAVREKTTVVFSTHILTDVERICDHVALLHGGKLALCGTLSEIRGSYRRSGFRIEFRNPEDARMFSECGELKSPGTTVSAEGAVLTIESPEEGAKGKVLIRLLAEKQMVPLHFEILEPSLERIFAEAVV